MTKQDSVPTEPDCATPLVELLRAVPKNARLLLADPVMPFCSHSIPVGRHCHDAADALVRATPSGEQPEPDGERTGWPPGLLQDDCKGLSKWLASRPDAAQRVREAVAEIGAQGEQPPDPAGRSIAEQVTKAFEEGIVYGQEHPTERSGKAIRRAADGDRADAERYRWLRDEGSLTWIPFRSQWHMTTEQCDSAIDVERSRSAMKAQP